MNTAGWTIVRETWDDEKGVIERKALSIDDDREEMSFLHATTETADLCLWVERMQDDVTDDDGYWRRFVWTGERMDEGERVVICCGIARSAYSAMQEATDAARAAGEARRLLRAL